MGGNATFPKGDSVSQKEQPFVDQLPELHGPFFLGRPVGNEMFQILQVSAHFFPGRLIGRQKRGIPGDDIPPLSCFGILKFREQSVDRRQDHPGMLNSVRFLQKGPEKTEGDDPHPEKDADRKKNHHKGQPAGIPEKGTHQRKNHPSIRTHEGDSEGKGFTKEKRAELDSTTGVSRLWSVR